MAVQISKDPQLMIEFGSILQSIPELHSLPHPSEMGVAGGALEMYERAFSNFQRLSQTGGDLKKLGAEISERGIMLKNNWVRRFLSEFFSEIHNSDAGKIKTALEKRDRYIQEYNKLSEFNPGRFFSVLDGQEGLSRFAGRITINGQTYNLLKSNSKRIIAPANFKESAELLPAPGAFSESSCTFRLVRASSYIDATAPEYFQEIYLFGAPINCDSNVFVPKATAEAFVNSLEIDGKYLDDTSEFLSEVFDFLKGSKKYLDSRRKDLFASLEKTAREIEELKSAGISALNSSEVLAALDIVQVSKGMVAVISNENPLVAIANSSNRFEAVHNLLTSCTSLGDCLEKQDNAEMLLHELELDAEYVSKSLDEFKTLFEGKCEFYVKASNSNVSCAFYGPRGYVLRKTAGSLANAYADYLLFSGQTAEAFGVLKQSCQAGLNDLETLLMSTEPFISRDFLVKQLSRISNFYDAIRISSDVEELQALLRDIGNARHDIEKKFFVDNADLAEEIRQKLLWYSEFSDFLDIDLEIPDLVNSPVSAFSDFVPKLVALLEFKDELSDLELRMQSKTDEYFSDIPSKIQCGPEVPPLGREFTVQCKLEVNNTYPGKISEAFVIDELTYPAVKALDSRNLVSGDLSAVESAVGKGTNIKIKVKNVQGPLFFEIRYASSLPQASYGLYNETMHGAVYEAYYSVEPDCSTETAYLFMPHPLNGFKMNASHEYFFDGKDIAVKVFCGQKQMLKFSGKAISIKVNGNDLVLENVLGKPIQTNLSLPYEPGFSVDSEFFVINDSVVIPINVTDKKTMKIFTEVPDSPLLRDNTSGRWQTEVADDSFVEFSGLNFTGDLRAAAQEALKRMAPVHLGCVEKDIVKDVVSRFTVPAIECIVVGEAVYQEAVDLFENEDYNAVLELYRKRPIFRDAEFYLANAAKYRKEAEDAIVFAKSSLEGPVARRRSQPYVDMASDAYAKKDYISAVYYAKYATIKAPLGLAFNWRLVLALALVAVGVWSQTRKKQEPLL